MASQNSTLFASQLNAAQGHVDYVAGTTSVNAQAVADSTESGGRVVIIADTYTPTSTMAASTVLGICKIPSGAKVVSVEFIVPASNSGVAQAG